MSKLSSIVTLIRPVNSIMIGFAVIVGVAVVAPSKVISQTSAFGFLTGFFVSGYSMVINDVYDVEIDRVNSPNRPIPSGAVTMKEAAVLASLFVLAGLASSLFIGVLNLAIVGFFALLAWGYSYWGKKKGLVGNTMVAASMAVPYVFGGVAIGSGADPMLWSLALTTFLAGTGREVVKTISDIEGDKTRGVQSVAITKGARAASRVGAMFFLAAVATSLVPVLLRVAGIIYATLVIITDVFFVYLSAKTIRNYNAEGAIRVKKLALGGMMLGLLAFLLGGALRF